MTTRQYARLVSEWIAGTGLDPKLFGPIPPADEGDVDLSAHRQSFGPSQLLPGHTKIESTVRYLGIEVDDALAIAEQVDA